MKSEQLIREHIKVLENAVDFTIRKGGKTEWIIQIKKNIEILKWVVDDKSQYDEIYNELMKLITQRK